MKRKQWTEESMLSAIKAVEVDREKVGVAARTFNVPRTTLRNRVFGRVTHRKKPGPESYLKTAEEDELRDFLIEVSDYGYGRSRREIKQIVYETCKQKEKEEKKKILKSNKISDGWFTKFIKRHDALSLRKGDPTAAIRMECLTKQRMTAYFQNLEICLQENDLMKSPGQIYNVDETGMPLDHCPPKVVGRKGKSKLRCRVTGNKAQITVVACVSASGQAIPPYIIFDTKTLNNAWTKGEVPGTRYGLSDKGWIDHVLFKHWLENHFIKHAVATRPLLLLLDGHSSHYVLETLKFAMEKDIIFCLPPHTTHASQPLDASVFAPLKRHWADACHRYLAKNPTNSVIRYEFSTLLNEAWMETMKPASICAGFRTCGVYPFDPKAVECVDGAITYSSPHSTHKGGE